MVIGKLIKAVRKAEGMNQTQLGRLLGISRTQVTNIELGNSGLTIQMVSKLSSALHFPFMLFLIETDAMGESDAKAIWMMKAFYEATVKEASFNGIT